MPRFVDCQGLAGAWTLGAVQAGFDLQHRVSLPGAFGDIVAEHNRGLLSPRGRDEWKIETGDPHEAWTPQEGVGALFGTPPCSGFSLLNKSKKENARGAGSGINNCMRELVTYATRCTGSDGKPGPEIVSLESVQGAYTQGRVLMQELLNKLCLETHQEYNLYHVLMSGASVGAPQMRHRYFPVWSRIPFGVDTPEEKRVVTYEDAISDLEGHPLTWDEQRYLTSATRHYGAEHRRSDGLFDAHIPEERERDMIVYNEVFRAGEWPQGYNLPAACEHLGVRPPSMEKAWDPEEQKYRGWRWPGRIKGNRSGWVLTGAATVEYLHYREPRLLTVRECSRLMGYPDDWTWPTTKQGQAGAWIGKCCPVDSGRWIAKKFLAALSGEPESPMKQLDAGEYIHNSTLLYRKWPGGNVKPREPLAA